MSRENVTGLLRLLQDFSQITIENTYLFKIVIEKNMETSLKPGFAQIFVLPPKKCEKKKKISVAQNLGGSSPPCSPARTPMHPRKFGNQVTVHRPSDRPTVRTTGTPI